jgi:anti-sigma factor ChrR (cupin superfamily)
MKTASKKKGAGHLFLTCYDTSPVEGQNSAIQNIIVMAQTHNESQRRDTPSVQCPL